MLAVMLLDKTVSFQAAHDKQRMQEATALRERAKINLVRDEELAKLLPVRVAIVEIELADGGRLSQRVTAVRGTPRNPMSRDEVIEKARDLILPVIGRDASERLIQSVLAIEEVSNIRDLRPLLQRADQ
jgi:2-methylcitrate dehydratase PrpD